MDPMATTVYRFENWAGRGPYNGSYWDGRPRLHAAHTGDPMRPSPSIDMNVSEMTLSHFHDLGAVYGFLLREDALKWFEGWIEPMEAAGFRLVEQRGVVVALGTTQVLFLPALDTVI